MFIEKRCHPLLSSVRAAYNALHMLSRWSPQEMAENNTATNILKKHLPSWKHFYGYKQVSALTGLAFFFRRAAINILKKYPSK